MTLPETIVADAATDPFADAARRAWQVRTAEAAAAAAGDQLRRAGGPDELVQQLEALARAEPPVDAADPTAGIGVVLLVGCEPMVRTCLTLLLEARGVAVVSAADGFEGLDKLVADRVGVRVALLDIGMRGCPPMTAVAEFRRVDPLLPVILLGTPAAGEPHDGVNMVVPAPFGVSDVLWAIDEVVNRGGS